MEGMEGGGGGREWREEGRNGGRRRRREEEGGNGGRRREGREEEKVKLEHAVQHKAVLLHSGNTHYIPKEPDIQEFSTQQDLCSAYRSFLIPH